MEKNGQHVNSSMKLLNEMEGKERMTIHSKHAKLKIRRDKNYKIIPPQRMYWGIEVAELIACYLEDEEEEYGYHNGELVPAMCWMGIDGPDDGFSTYAIVDSASKFYIALKELIIEWKDIQSELVGYVHCDACFETVDPNREPVWITTPHDKNEDYVKLARFVKEPGRKITLLEIKKSDMQFFPIKLWSIVSERKIYDYSGTEINRKYCPLEVEIRSFFEEDEILPIKHACITVEIIVK